MKKSLLQRLGLLGVVSFLSYTAAVVFAPLAYPGYNWMAQAVSDLSAANAPSLALWNQLSALYNVCEVVCVTVVCIGIQGRKTKLLRSGIFLFAVMEWISAVGYRMFPLSDSGYAGAFQDVMHMAVTALVVLLSIVSLTIIIVAGVKSKSCRSYGVCAAVALAMMLVGAMGMKIVPAAYFGVVERFSVFAATGFNAALGIHLFCMKSEIKTQPAMCAKKNRPRAVLFFSHICGSGFFSSSSRRCSSPIMSSKAVKSALSTSSWAARSCWDRAAFIVR